MKLTKKQIGGLTAAEKIRYRYGEDFWTYLGSKGGSAKSSGKGFGSDKITNGLTGAERAKIAGSKGGKERARRLRERMEKGESDDQGAN